MASPIAAGLLPLIPLILAFTTEKVLLSTGFSISKYLVAPITVFILAQTWLSFVNSATPIPYLDEIFHIPQAQNYCAGHWTEWDNKITTPPGLYIVSIIFMKLRILGSACSPSILRSTNVWAIASVALLATLCRRRIEKASGEKGVSRYALHIGLNVALFPGLFFFSGLYYTDIISTVFVLIAYWVHLGRINYGRSLFSDLLVIIVGVISLTMRQTNVFWVVIYMGGLEVVHIISKISSSPGFKKLPSTPQTTLRRSLYVVWFQYANGQIHDPELSSAWPDDIAISLLSISIAAIFHPVRVIKQVWPHVVTMALFGGFIAWNGGVVLGDKSNHIATIHLAQLLYIWPLFVVFSWPVMIVSGLSGIATILSLPAIFSGWSEAVLENKQRSQVLTLVQRAFKQKWYYVPYLFFGIIVSAAIVKFNTIVHPFTLADNRHYMFYVFRYTIRKSQHIRLALVGPYVICRWLSWGALYSKGEQIAQEHVQSSFYNHPFLPPPIYSDESAKNSNAASTPTPSEQAPTCSTASLFILATTLSLITAPLVEPRYFILPWVLWRLLIPSWSVKYLHNIPIFVLIRRLPWAYWAYDIRLPIETLWYLVFNLATMYIFIYKGYVWKSSDGTILENGILQRFMY